MKIVQSLCDGFEGSCFDNHLAIISANRSRLRAEVQVRLVICGVVQIALVHEAEQHAEKVQPHVDIPLVGKIDLFGDIRGVRRFVAAVVRARAALLVVGRCGLGSLTPRLRRLPLLLAGGLRSLAEFTANGGEHSAQLVVLKFSMYKCPNKSQIGTLMINMVAITFSNWLLLLFPNFVVDRW